MQKSNFTSSFTHIYLKDAQTKIKKRTLQNIYTFTNWNKIKLFNPNNIPKQHEIALSKNNTLN